MQPEMEPQNNNSTIETGEGLALVPQGDGVVSDFRDWIKADPLSNGTPSSEGVEPAPGQASGEQNASTPPQNGAPSQPGLEAQTSPAGQPSISDGHTRPLDTARELQQMREQIAHLNGIAQSAQQASQPQQPQSKESQVAQEAEIRFGFQLPDQIWAQLDSEDPMARRAAFTQVLNATATISAQKAHQEAMSQVDARFQQLGQTLPQYMQQQQQLVQQQQSVAQDFYGAYPQLQNPALQGIVRDVAGRVMQETGQTAWTPQLRDAIGQRVMQVMQQVTGQPAQPQVPQQPQRQQAMPGVQPATISRGGMSARPAPAPGNDDPIGLFHGLGVMPTSS